MTLSYTILRKDVEDIIDGLEEVVKTDHEYENIKHSCRICNINSRMYIP